MILSHLTLYQIAPGFVGVLSACEESLAKNAFVPCSPSQEISLGWIPARGEKNGPLIEAIHGQWMLLLQIETKSVPNDLVKRRVEERCEKIEAETGRKPGKRERKELKEDIIQELLPQAFPKLKQIPVWIDPNRMQLGVGIASATQADAVVTMLVKSLESFGVNAFVTHREPTQSMSAWLMEYEAPELDIGRSVELKAPGEHGATVRYDAHALDIPAIAECIKEGMFVTRLHFIWQDRISFTLCDDFTLRSLKFLGSQEVSGPDAFDADIVLETSELNLLIDVLVECLGGIRPAVDPNQTTIVDMGGDDLYAQAVTVVLEHQKASISLVQRYLKIGYNRAAGLLEQMEKNGVVSPMGEDGVRTILKGAR